VRTLRIFVGALFLILALLSSFGSGSVKLEGLILGVMGLAFLLGPAFFRLCALVQKNNNVREKYCECCHPNTQKKCSNKAEYVVSFVPITSDALFGGKDNRYYEEYFVCEKHHPHIGEELWWVQNAERNGFKIRLIEHTSL